MDKKEKVELLKLLTAKEIGLSSVCESLEMNGFEVLGLIRDLREDGINISINQKDDDIYLFNQGERELGKEYAYKFYTDNNNEFKFVAISDTRFGSKYQQLSVLNDIYQKAYEMGYNNVIHCGNLTEGLYKVTNKYSEDMFLADSLQQVDYITQYYPYVEGINTYFITGKKDEKHLTTNKINIGKRISDLREDMIYLGQNSCNTEIDNTKMLLLSSSLQKTYTMSYRPQQQIDSFRSEDKPDILLFGGLLQMDKLTYRNIRCLSIPSVCATTREMNDRRFANTIGAWYITVKTDKYGNLDSLRAMDSVYYKTNKDDYTKRKVLRLERKD